MEQIGAIPDPTVQTPVRSTARYLVWGYGVITFGLVLIGFALAMLAVIASDGAMNPFTHVFFLPLMTAAYGIIGVLVAVHHPDNVLSWLLCLVGMFSAFTLLSNAYQQYALYTQPEHARFIVDLFAWLDKWIWWIPSILPLTHILLLFPTGRLPSPRWRWVSWSAGIGLIGGLTGTALHPGEMPQFGIPDANPFGFAGAEPFLEPMLYLATVFLLIGVFGAFASVIVRFRNAVGKERVQLKWLAYAVGIVLAAFILTGVVWALNQGDPFILEIAIIVNVGGVTLIVLVIGLAILRHNLWDIDLLINRTLVYGLLSLIVLGMYIMIVSFLGTLLDGDHHLYSLIATGMVAITFQPLRDVLQRTINRQLFGYRDEPYKVLERLAQRLEPVMVTTEVLPVIVETIVEALRLPYAEIALRYGDQFKTVATYPSLEIHPRQTATEIVPLIYNSETVGRLALTPRGLEEAFSAAEQQLLDTIARQTAIAVHNVRLTEDLQHSRERLVTTREEERRRLRRDLHDGLGPILAAMAFRLDAIKNFISTDPEQARQLVAELKTQVQSSLSEIRRIAYNLRPPALDELGLLGALREHFASIQQQNGFRLTFDAPESLPALPAAVEVVVYRIAMEAVANVQHHANASSCTVTISLDEAASLLYIEIMDDGQGIDAIHPAGVGLTAMHERTSELGGKCIITDGPDGGTQVSVQLPVRYEN